MGKKIVIQTEAPSFLHASSHQFYSHRPVCLVTELSTLRMSGVQSVVETHAHNTLRACVKSFSI